MLNNKKILIIGAGKSGMSVIKLLLNNNNDITLTDTNPLSESDMKYLENNGIKVIITKDQVDLIDNSWDLVIKNPAIMYTSKISQKLIELNVPTTNEMELAYHYLPKNITIIGVTGSNGKTTTTTLIYEFLKLAGKNVVLAGNIGYALCEKINEIKEDDILLLEISDHQLCDFKDFKTNISVLTNICPTHLDYHGTYEHYKQAKKKIFEHHNKNDYAIINKKDADSLEITSDIESEKIYFNNETNYIKDGKIYINNQEVLKTDDIKIKGMHNYENIIMALLVTSIFNINMNIVKDFLKNFGGVEHRIEFVCEKNRVEYYNDSKSTNPTATITALKTFNKPIHLILGGLNRNQDFNELNDYIGNVKCIYAIGEVTNQVVEYANTKNIKVYPCIYLKDALKIIKENVEPGDIVLLSPGSSSQDQYAHFENRGDEFKSIVETF